MIPQILAVGLATFRVSILLSEDVIANSAREFFFRLDRRLFAYKPHLSPFYAWANCPRCNGVWFAILLWIVYAYFPVVVWLFAAMGVQVLCLTVFKMGERVTLSMHDVNHENPKEDVLAKDALARFVELSS